MAKLTLHLSRTNVLAGVGGWSTWPSHLECLLHAGHFQKIMLRWNLGDRQCNPWGAGEYLWAKSSLSRSTTKGKEASVHNHRHRPRRSSSTSAKCTTRGGTRRGGGCQKVSRERLYHRRLWHYCGRISLLQSKSCSRESPPGVLGWLPVLARDLCFCHSS